MIVIKREELNWLVKFFLIWRILLLIIGLIAIGLIPFRSDFAYTKYSFYLSDPTYGLSTIIEPWANFDGVHYLNIAERGYVDEFRFFPLLPIVIALISFGNIEWGLWVGFILAQFLAFGALYMLYRLLRLDYSTNTVRWAIVCLLAFPTSFFLGSIYTESLFLLLTTSSLYLARKELWLESGIVAALASATRIVGIALVPALLIGLWIKKSFINIYSKIAAISLGAGGLLAYGYYLQAKFGNALLFIEGHTTLGNSRSAGLVNPLRTVVRYARILTTLKPNIHEWWVALLEITSFIFASALLYIAWKKVNKSYWWYAVFAFSIPVLSGTFTGLPRYIIILFPIFIALPLVEKKWVKILYLCISVPLLIICTILFTRGYFIA